MRGGGVHEGHSRGHGKGHRGETGSSGGYSGNARGAPLRTTPIHFPITIGVSRKHLGAQRRFRNSTRGRERGHETPPLEV